jgi:serpin B
MAFNEQAVVSRSVSDFMRNLYDELRKKEGNIFFSPYSISGAMSLVYSGAKGRTLDQIRKVFGYQEVNPSNLVTTLESIGNYLNSGDGKVVTNIANAAWLEENFKFLESYLSILGDRTKLVDYSNPEEVRQKINAWVEEITKNKIVNLIAEGVIKPDMAAVLANAIYFNGTWTEPFDAEYTTKESFHHLNGDVSQVDMMINSFEYGNYYSTPEYEIVRIPYGDKLVNMVVILPNDMANFDANFKHFVVPYLQRAHVFFHMPKFKLEGTFQLAEQLQAIGVEDAFDESKADFSNMAEKPLYLSDVIHKANIEVCEKGTEAAAATVITVRACGASMEAPKTVTVKVDRPFVFLIEDTYGTPLFMGRVTKL